MYLPFLELSVLWDYAFLQLCFLSLLETLCWQGGWDPCLCVLACVLVERMIYWQRCVTFIYWQKPSHLILLYITNHPFISWRCACGLFTEAFHYKKSSITYGKIIRLIPTIQKWSHGLQLWRMRVNQSLLQHVNQGQCWLRFSYPWCRFDIH